MQLTLSLKVAILETVVDGFDEVVKAAYEFWKNEKT